MTLLGKVNTATRTSGLLLVLALVLAALAPASAQAAFGAIAGTVTAPGAAEEVEVCVVEALPSETCTKPLASGQYTLGGLSPGAYFVEFLPSYRSGFVRQYYPGRPTLEGAQKVFVAAENTTRGIDAELVIGGTVEGQATDALTALPVEAVEVCALGPAEAPFGCTQTDALGDYALPTLPPGSYRIGFWGEGAGAGYLTRFYAGAATAEAATPVAVSAASATTGIDAALAQGGRIEGTVTAAQGGGPLPGIVTCLLAAASPAPSRCTHSGADGGYAFGGLASGAYTVVFSPQFREFEAAAALPAEEDGFLTQYYAGAATRAAATTISLLAPQQIPGIDAALLPAPPWLQTVPTARPGPPAIAPAAAAPAAPLSPPPVKPRCRRPVKPRAKRRRSCTRRHRSAHRHRRSRHHRAGGSGR